MPSPLEITIRAIFKLQKIIKNFESNLKASDKKLITKGYLDAQLATVKEYWTKFQLDYQKAFNMRRPTKS